jgi:adenylylsulfate kinase
MKKGFTIWLTGLPCCGKSTIADKLYYYLLSKGIHSQRLDGDMLRENLCRDLGFSKKDRDTNIDRVIFLSKLLNDNGANTINTFITPYQKSRDEARDTLKNYIEVYVECPLEICENRDVKGMYKLAREGKIKNFTGVNDPYEIPKNPDVIVYSGVLSVDECVLYIVDNLEHIGYI